MTIFIIFFIGYIIEIINKYVVIKKIILKGQRASQGFWIYLYYRIRLSFAHLRPIVC